MTPPNEPPAALLPCPMCGAAAKMEIASYAYRKGYRIHCCIVDTGEHMYENTCVEEWNTRASPAPAASDSRGSGVVDGWRKHELLDIARCLRFPQGYGSTRTELRACMISFGEQIQRIVKGLPEPDAAPAPPAVASGEPIATEFWKRAISDDMLSTFFGKGTRADWIEYRARQLAEGKK